MSREERDLRKRLDPRTDEVSDELLSGQEGREARFAIEQRLKASQRNERIARLFNKSKSKKNKRAKRRGRK